MIRNPQNSIGNYLGPYSISTQKVRVLRAASTKQPSGLLRDSLGAHLLGDLQAPEQQTPSKDGRDPGIRA